MRKARTDTIELYLQGVDCAGCARNVHQAITDVPGVVSAEVLLAAEKAQIKLERNDAEVIDRVKRAIESAGYKVVSRPAAVDPAALSRDSSKRIFWLFGFIFALVLGVVVVGEWLDYFGPIKATVPWWAGALAVAGLGFPVFRQVLRAALHGRILAHTLMAVGALAALAAGEWITALVIVTFMRVGDYAERFTADRARESLHTLTRMAPERARVMRHGHEHMVGIEEVVVGDEVVVRPGEKIPVDGRVLSGRATINQAAITGESMPVDVEEGHDVFAATIAEFGALRVKAAAVGAATTFGRVIKMVEEAEAHRGDVQRLADRFATYYLPVVAVIAALTYLFSQSLSATIAVLVVACPCAFALATPVAIVASVGAAARRGLLIKGGKHLETLDRADVVLLDKTGTLTLGRPRITDIVRLNGLSEDELLHFAATAERYSEHPLAGAVRHAAIERGIALGDPDRFEAIPGMGVRARVDNREVAVGNARLVTDGFDAARRLAREGKTILYVQIDGDTAGILAAADTNREEVPAAIEALRAHGIRHIELLTGDTEASGAALAESLGISYRAGLLPDDKIAIVRDYQRRGHTVVMIGDGVNDAPALAQADVGIAMGAKGSDVAMEASHVALMEEDWSRIPTLFQITRRTMKVVRLNIGFTAVYNVIGISLAAFGFLPPVYAAALQSVPDLGIMANSVRLLKQED
jgi:P-type Cu+ transporter